MQRSRKKGRSRRKPQRLYNMKGCSKTKCVRRKKRYLGLKGGSSNAYPIMTQPRQFNFLNSLQGGGCSSCGLQTGGNCEQCSLIGGYNTKGGGSAFIGAALNPSDINSWPGVDGTPHNGNYYKLNNLYTQTSMNGIINGGMKKRRKSKQRGAGMSNLLYNDLTNIGRQVTNGLGSAYNTLNGYPAPVSPLPTEGQLVKR